MGPFLDTEVAAEKHGFMLSYIRGVDIAGFEAWLPGKLLCGWRMRQRGGAPSRGLCQDRHEMLEAII